MANWVMCQRLKSKDSKRCSKCHGKGVLPFAWDGWQDCECQIEWFNIQFEGMDRPTTVIRQVGETMEELIARTRRKWSAREAERGKSCVN